MRGLSPRALDTATKRIAPRPPTRVHPSYDAIIILCGCLRDLAGKAAARRRRSKIVRRVVGDAEHVGRVARDRELDVALVVDTFHHIPNRPTYFRELTKLLNPEGRVAIVDFRKDSPEGPPPEFRLEAVQIVAEMAQAGYRLEAEHGFLPRQHFLVFRATGR